MTAFVIKIYRIKQRNRANSPPKKTLKTNIRRFVSLKEEASEKQKAQQKC